MHFQLKRRNFTKILKVMDSTSNSLVVLQVYDNTAMAEIAKSVLDDAGIYCDLHGEYMSAIYCAVAFPVRLMVMAEDVDKARKLLDIE